MSFYLSIQDQFFRSSWKGAGWIKCWPLPFLQCMCYPFLHNLPNLFAGAGCRRFLSSIPNEFLAKVSTSVRGNIGRKTSVQGVFSVNTSLLSPPQDITTSSDSTNHNFTTRIGRRETSTAATAFGVLSSRIAWK